MRPQRWAQQRNFSKMRLEGIRGTLISLKRERTMTETERIILSELSKTLNDIMVSWRICTVTSKKQNVTKETNKS